MGQPKVGHLLVSRGLLSESDLKKALQMQSDLKAKGKSALLGTVLVHFKFVSQEALDSVLRDQRKLAEKAKVAPINTKADLVNRIGEFNLITINEKTRKPFVPSTANDHILVCADKSGRPVLLISEQARSMFINPLKATLSALKDAYKDDQVAQSRISAPVLVQSEIIKLLRDAESQKEGAATKSAREEEFSRLMEIAYEAKATDVHFFRRKESCQIRFRVYGELVDYEEWHIDRADEMLSVAFSSQGEGGKDSHWKKEQSQRRRIQIPISNYVTLDCRYEHAPGDAGSYHAVIRLMPNDKREVTKVIDLESLGFTSGQAKLLRTGVMKASGAVLIAGPTGSGKSTTMAALIKWLHHVNNGKLNILTVESPIERELPAFQVTVSEDEDGQRDNFAEAIKSTLRRDPDFLMVGEIRDPASAAALVNGVQTGHPVLTTVHAQSALEIVERMAGPGMNVPAQTLASPSFISALCYQMLLPKLDESSKIRVTKQNMKELLGPDLTTRVLEVCPNVDEANIHIRGNSNPQYPEGISGMTICAEVVTPDYKMREHFRNLEITEALAHWRRAGEQHRRTQGKRLESQVVGFSALDHAIAKMLKGLIDPRDVELHFGLINMQNIMRDGVFEEDEATELFSDSDETSSELNYEGFLADDEALDDFAAHAPTKLN